MPKRTTENKIEATDQERCNTDGRRNMREKGALEGQRYRWREWLLDKVEKGGKGIRGGGSSL